MLRLLGAATIAIALTLSACPGIFAADDAPVCNSIANANLANMTINVPDQGPVRLKNAKGYIPKIGREENEPGSEWEVTIEQDILLEPSPGIQQRLINLNADHILGTGAWGYALIYACQDGHLRRVFQSIGHLYGVQIAKISETSFTLTYGVYLKGDANCCPSMQATDTYEWARTEGQYKMTKRVKGPFKNE